MKIDWNGRELFYDDRRVTVSQARILKTDTGLDWPMQFVEAIGKMDPAAIQGLMWLVRAQNGYQERIDDVDGSIMEFIDAYSAGVDVELAKRKATEDGAADPTPVALSGDSPGTSTTSETSTS